MAFIQGQSLLEVDVTCLLFLPWLNNYRHSLDGVEDQVLPSFFFITLKFKRCIFLIIIGRGMYSRAAFVSDYFTLISSINRGRHLIE